MAPLKASHVALFLLASVLTSSAYAQAPSESRPVLDATPIRFVVRESVTPLSPLFQAGPTPANRTTSKTPPRLFLSLYASHAALQVLDVHSTVRAISAGGRELNPVMSGVASHPLGLLLVKSGATAATIYFTEKLRVRHPVAAIALMVGVNCAYVAVVVHNYRGTRANP